MTAKVGRSVCVVVSLFSIRFRPHQDVRELGEVTEDTLTGQLTAQIHRCHRNLAAKNVGPRREPGHTTHPHSAAQRHPAEPL